MAARRDEIDDEATALAAGEIVLPWMRQADPGTCLAQGPNRLLEARPVLLHVTELAGAEPLAKGLGTIADMAGTHEKLGEVGTSRRVAAVAQFLLDRPCTLQRARHALGLEPLGDLFGPPPAPFVQLRDRLLQRWRIGGEGITQYMNGSPVPQARVRCRLPAAPQRQRSRPSLGEAIDGVGSVSASSWTPRPWARSTSLLAPARHRRQCCGNADRRSSGNALQRGAGTSRKLSDKPGSARQRGRTAG